MFTFFLTQVLKDGQGQATLEEKLARVDRQIATLFNDAVLGGDLSIAKLLHGRYGVDLNGRNEEGLAAIHLACILGHEDIIQWFVGEEKIDLEKADNLGYRAIHHAVQRWQIII